MLGLLIGAIGKRGATVPYSFNLGCGFVGALVAYTLTRG
jgi:hypothetical protein